MDHGKAKIIIGSDLKTESAITSSEVQEKLYWLVDDNKQYDWPTLVAGTLSKASELREVYRQYFSQLKKKGVLVTRENISDIVKKPLALQKRKLATHYVRMQLGIDYKDFLLQGKNTLPSEEFEDMTRNIREIDLGCSLILCTFIKGLAYIFKTDKYGRVTFSEHFAAIGSGSVIAESVMHQREHEYDISLGQATYHVYEAMKLGAKAPGVGSQHLISCLFCSRDSGIKLQNLNESGHKYLATRFKRYGPKEFWKMGIRHTCFDEPI